MANVGRQRTLAGPETFKSALRRRRDGSVVATTVCSLSNRPASARPAKKNSENIARTLTWQETKRLPVLLLHKPLVAPTPDRRRMPKNGTALRLRNVVLAAAAADGWNVDFTDSPSARSEQMKCTRKDVASTEFAEQCLMSLAVWRRFGTAEFAEALGWVQRTDMAATTALLDRRCARAAVDVWRGGRHVVACSSEAQRCAHLAELRAWELGAPRDKNGGASDGLKEAEQARCLVSSAREVAVADSEIARLRSVRTTLAGEGVVRSAYLKLLNAFHHPMWDLWRKRGTIVAVLLGDGDFSGLREALSSVRGYEMSSPETDWAGWELALDLKTLTPLADDPQAALHSSEYTLWLREKITQRYGRSASSVATGRPADIGFP
eukprot:TRINITY_DN70350_c0_g1_i1.p1 TRINITY_DN70350_c0_g1~~TRINITY_DN70350_c0_g1_i1.p1  ORF type:complete len:379 (-),score=60.59 TRINITY_DN70350_c0_g1_i1:295-1431(-)